MSLIGIVLALVIVGVVLWLVNTYIPMDPKIKQIINILVVIVVILWVLGFFVPGLWGGAGGPHLPR